MLSRGNKKQDVFLTWDDRLHFLDTVGRMAERFDISVFAYVLMPNHYHLLIQTDKPNLSRAMHWIGCTYTVGFNYRNARVGHLFQGRFKSILVENDAHLFQLSCYIHRNPVRAGLTERLADYPWSSYPAYAYRKKAPPWLEQELILAQAGGDDPQGAYRRIVQAYASEEEHFWENLRHGLFFGSQAFVERITGSRLGSAPDPELPQQRQALRETEPLDVLKKAAVFLNCDLEHIRKARRIRGRDLEMRDLMIYLLWQIGAHRNHEIGELFGVSYSLISRRISLTIDRLGKDRGFREKLDELNSLFKI